MLLQQSEDEVDRRQKNLSTSSSTSACHLEEGLFVLRIRGHKTTRRGRLRLAAGELCGSRVMGRVDEFAKGTRQLDYVANVVSEDIEAFAKIVCGCRLKLEVGLLVFNQRA